MEVTLNINTSVGFNLFSVRSRLLWLVILREILRQLVPTRHHTPLRSYSSES